MVKQKIKKDFPKLSPFASRLGVMITFVTLSGLKYQCRINFYGPKDVQDIEVLLYLTTCCWLNSKVDPDYIKPQLFIMLVLKLNMCNLLPHVVSKNYCWMSGKRLHFSVQIHYGKYCIYSNMFDFGEDFLVAILDDEQL